MANRARHVFGPSEKVEGAISEGRINERDILLMDEDTDNPKIGWIKKDGTPVYVQNEKADLTELETEIAKKADAAAVQEQIVALSDGAKAYTDRKVEAAIAEHLVRQYEISDAPEGTLIDYRDNEIRIMCPADAEYTKQSVGEGGDPNCYYITLKTYVYNDDITGYIEHLGSQVDENVLTNFSVDKNGRRYQSTWLAVAKYDETEGVWSYYGKNSSANKYIGWDYRIDFYNAAEKMISSDSIRINLSNEECHSIVEPYYIAGIKTEIDEKINEIVTEIETGYEIIEL